MKNVSFLFTGFILLILFAYGCNTDNKTDAKKMLDGKWLLRTLNGKEVVRKKTGATMPYLSFDLATNILGGNTGCNDLGGKISVTETEIIFSDMSVSKMFCSDAEYETEFVGNIFHADPLKYKIYDNVLTITKDDEDIMTFMKSR